VTSEDVTVAGQVAGAEGGLYVDSYGGVQAFVVDESGGSWGAAEEVPGLAALNAGGWASVSSVSCPSAGNCAAGDRIISFVQESWAGRSAVVAPGGNYGADGPLLMYAALAVQRRGGNSHRIAWELPGGLDFSELREHVASRVGSAVDDITATAGSAPVIIGKSLGSLAARVAADRGLAAVWFTPLLIDEPTVAALRRATAPYLLVGGTNDQFWDGQAARSLAADVLEIDGADHGMFVPGRLAASATVLGQVITAVEDFLDRIA
jgi:hypothetical protein